MKINGTNKDIPAGYYMPAGDFKIQEGDLVVQQEQYLAGGKPWEALSFTFGRGHDWWDIGIKIYVFRPIPVPAGYELLQAPYVVQKGDFTISLSVLQVFGATARTLEEASEHDRVGNTSSFMEESPVFVTFRPLKKAVEVSAAPESKLPDEVKALDEKVEALNDLDNHLSARLDAVERTVFGLQRRIEYPVAAARTGRLTTAANYGRITASEEPRFRVLRDGSIVQEGDFVLNRSGKWSSARISIGHKVGDRHPYYSDFLLVAKRSI